MYGYRPGGKAAGPVLFERSVHGMANFIYSTGFGSCHAIVGLCTGQEEDKVFFMHYTGYPTDKTEAATGSDYLMHPRWLSHAQKEMHRCNPDVWYIVPGAKEGGHTFEQIHKQLGMRVGAKMWMLQGRGYMTIGVVPAPTHEYGPPQLVMGDEMIWSFKDIPKYRLVAMDNEGGSMTREDLNRTTPSFRT